MQPQSTNVLHMSKCIAYIMYAHAVHASSAKYYIHIQYTYVHMSIVEGRYHCDGLAAAYSPDDAICIFFSQLSLNPSNVASTQAPNSGTIGCTVTLHTVHVHYTNNYDTNVGIYSKI